MCDDHAASLAIAEDIFLCIKGYVHWLKTRGSEQPCLTLAPTRERTFALERPLSDNFKFYKAMDMWQLVLIKEGQILHGQTSDDCLEASIHKQHVLAMWKLET